MSDTWFAVYKAAQSLVLPPASLLMVAFACLLLARRRRWAVWVGAVSLVLLAVLATPLVGNALVSVVESGVRPLDEVRLAGLDRRSSAIVVLGGGRRLGAREVPGGEDLHPVPLQRCRYGARLAKRSGLAVAVSGGKPDGGRSSEAELMRSFIAQELGQPVAIVEGRSRDTLENARFTLAMLGQGNVRSVVLVTDALHMPRAVRAFEAQGVRVLPAPTNYRARAARQLSDYVPSEGGLRHSTMAIRELLGGLVYRLRA